MLDIAKKRAATVGFHRHPQALTCVAFSPDGKSLAAGTRDGFLKVFSVKPLASVSDAAGKNRANPGGE
jgi:WD40 repeat protein